MFEDKQRLWLDELEDLKQMYMARLQQVTQQAQRGQRALQLQLYKAQQEKKRLQEELNMQQCQCEEAKLRQSQGERVSPKLEETKWEVSPLPSLPPATLLAARPRWGPWFSALVSPVATGWEKKPGMVLVFSQGCCGDKNGVLAPMGTCSSLTVCLCPAGVSEGSRDLPAEAAAPGHPGGDGSEAGRDLQPEDAAARGQG